MWMIMSTTPLCVAFRSVVWAWVLWSLLVCIGFWGVMPVTLCFIWGSSCWTLVGRCLLFFYKKLKNVSCEYNPLNGWNSTLQAAWYIRHARWACLFYISFIIWCLWTKPTIRWLILSFTILRKVVRACSTTSIFYVGSSGGCSLWLVFAKVRF